MYYDVPASVKLVQVDHSNLWRFHRTLLEGAPGNPGENQWSRGHISGVPNDHPYGSYGSYGTSQTEPAKLS